jgi:hypothetical protein
VKKLVDFFPNEELSERGIVPVTDLSGLFKIKLGEELSSKEWSGQKLP